MNNTVNVKFTKKALNYLKGYTLMKRPCGAERYIKTRELVAIEKRKVTLPVSPDSFTSGTFIMRLGIFYFSDGTIAYERKYFRWWRGVVHRCSYLTEKGSSTIVDEFLWYDIDFKNLYKENV